jgi:outer membrane protein assembly factor BamA
VGYGAAGALIFIDKPMESDKAGFGRPNISAIGALGTDNGSRGAFAGDVRHWLDERLKTVAAIVRASVNLDFYGIGRDATLQDNPRRYNLETLAGVVQARYRLGNSQAWAGLGYALANTTVSFDLPPVFERAPDFQRDSRVGGLLPTLIYDSRNNVFTPTSGAYLEASAGLFSKSLGSDSDFQRVSLTAIQFLPLERRLTFGINGGAVLSYGDVPFYLRPFIQLRGIPAMRYQGDHTAQVEAELRWQFWERFSLVGFAGTGVARNAPQRVNRDQQASSGGLGFRYEIARKYGLHMGLDVAYGPDGPALYVQFGSAWARP